MKKRFFELLAVIAALIHGHASAAGAHEHGAATLHAAIEADRLHLSFSSPLDNLVGFERAPRNDKEREAVKRMVERLRSPERLFVPTPEARCTRSSVDLDSPVIDPKLLGNAAKPAPSKSASGSHASIEAEIAFRCERAQALSGIDVKAFDAFPHLKRIDAQVAGAKKQAGAKLTPRNTRLSW